MELINTVPNKYLLPKSLNITPIINMSSSVKEEFNNISDTLAAVIDDEDVPLIQSILDFLHLYYLGFITILGLLGHGANVLAFKITKRKLSSPSYYLTALSLVDFVFLVTIFILWLTHFDVELFFQPGVYQGLFYLSSTSSCISAWLVAAFTFERLIVVRYPLKRTKICTVRRAKVIIVSITVMAAIFQLVSFFPTGKKGTGIKRNDSNSTDAAGTHQKTDRAVPFHYEIIRIFSILDTVVTLVIPPVIIVFFNGFIIQGLAEFNKTFKKGTNKHGPSLRKSTLQSDDSHQVNIRMKAMRTKCELKKSRSPDNIRKMRKMIQKNEDDGVGDDGEHQQKNLVMEYRSSSSSVSMNSSMKYSNTIIMAVVEVRHEHQTLSLSSQHHQKLTSAMASSPSLRNDDEISIELIQEDETAASILAEAKNADGIITGDGGVGDTNETSVLRGLAPSDELATAAVRSLGDGQQREEIDARSVIQHQTHLDLDAIETDPSASNAPLPQPANDCSNTEHQKNTTDTIAIDQLDHQQPSPLIRRNGIKIKCPSVSNRTEYSITKKLVLISAVHILLNLPSYAMNLKGFIDETITSNSEFENSWTALYLQQFAMLLYHTSFSINFLLYPNPSNGTFNLRRLLVCCKKD